MKDEIFGQRLKLSNRRRKRELQVVTPPPPQPCFSSGIVNQTFYNERTTSYTLPPLCALSTLLAVTITVPSYIAYNPVLKKFTCTSIAGQVGTFVFILELKHQVSLALVKYYLSITIIENQAPYFQCPPETKLEIRSDSLSSYTLPILEKDPQNDPITINLLNQPLGYNFYDVATRTFTFDPSLSTPALFEGFVFTIDYELSDGFKATAYSINVLCTIDATPIQPSPIGNQAVAVT